MVSSHFCSLAAWFPFTANNCVLQCTECHKTTNAATRAEFTSTFSTTDNSSTNAPLFPWEFAGEVWFSSVFLLFSVRYLWQANWWSFSLIHSKVTFVLSLLKQSKQYCSLRKTIQWWTTIKTSCINSKDNLGIPYRISQLVQRFGSSSRTKGEFRF